MSVFVYIQIIYKKQTVVHSLDADIKQKVVITVAVQPSNTGPELTAYSAVLSPNMVETSSLECFYLYMYSTSSGSLLV